MSSEVYLLWWKRPGISDQERSETMAARRGVEQSRRDVNEVLWQRREVKSRNGIAPAIREAMRGGPKR